MATINLFTTASASLNRHRIEIFERTSNTSLSPFASLIKDPPHPSRKWTFDGLIPSRNYEFVWTEIDGNAQTIQTYAAENFTVPSVGSISIKPSSDYEVGIDPEFVEDQTVAILTDGISWQPSTVEEVPGAMKRDQAYSWDTSTGTLTLLGEGHTFIAGQRYVIQWEPKVIPSASIVSPNLWSDIIVATADLTLGAEDIGKKILISADASIINIYLPEITSVPENRLFFFESLKGNHINPVIRSPNVGSIDWLKGNRTNIYMGTNESFSLYRHGSVWHVHDAKGNYATTGRRFLSDMDTEDNALELNGQTINVYEYVRIWQDYISLFSPGQMVSYDQQPIGNNRTKFSLPNSQGLLRLPDVRGLYQINVGAFINPFDFVGQQMVDARVHIMSDAGSGDRKPGTNTYLAWTSNRANGNQDYDLCKTDVPPTLGLSSTLVDQYGNPFPVGDKLRVDSFASRMFIMT